MSTPSDIMPKNTAIHCIFDHRVTPKFDHSLRFGISPGGRRPAIRGFASRREPVMPLPEGRFRKANGFRTGCITLTGNCLSECNGCRILAMSVKIVPGVLCSHCGLFSRIRSESYLLLSRTIIRRDRTVLGQMEMSSEPCAGKHDPPGSTVLILGKCRCIPVMSGRFRASSSSTCDYSWPGHDGP